MKKLISMLKVINNNIKILHHNLIGETWFTDHSLLADYYEKIGDIEDSVIEMFIMLGGKDILLSEAILDYPEIDVRKYSRDEAFSLCLKFFNDLVNQIDEVKSEIPSDCVSELESYQYWLRLESRYKILHSLGDNN